MSSRSKASLAAWLTLLFAMLMAACSGAGNEASRVVSPADAHKLVAAGATLLDVRSPGEWQQGHIEGAVLIPVGEVEQRMSEVPRDKPVIVYCASGGRASTATETLRQAGYDARNLGGMKRWYE